MIQVKQICPISFLDCRTISEIVNAIRVQGSIKEHGSTALL